MKSKNQICILLSTVALLGMSTVSNAQIGLSLQGIGAKTSLDNSKFQPGGGASLKAFLGTGAAIGISAKYMATSYDSEQSIGENLKNKGYIMPITGTFDLYLTDGFFRPYLGVEAGSFRRVTKILSSGNQITKVKDSRFGITPKAGIAISFGGIGLFAEANYNMIYGNKNGSTSIGSGRNISWKNPNRLWAFSTGIIFGFPGSK